MKLITGDLYSVVADCARDYAHRHEMSDMVAVFDISYNGKQWTTCHEIITFDENFNIVFLNDWCEGQTYIKNVKIALVEEIQLKHKRAYLIE